MPRLKRLVACLTPLRLGFDSKPVHVRLVVDKVAVSFHQFCVFIIMYMLLLPEGQMIEAWEPSRKEWCFGNRGALGRKLLLLSLKSVRTAFVAMNSCCLPVWCLWWRRCVFCEVGTWFSLNYADEFEPWKRLTKPTCREKLPVSHLVKTFCMLSAVAFARAHSPIQFISNSLLWWPPIYSWVIHVGCFL